MEELAEIELEMSKMLAQLSSLEKQPRVKKVIAKGKLVTKNIAIKKLRVTIKVNESVAKKEKSSDNTDYLTRLQDVYNSEFEYRKEIQSFGAFDLKEAIR